MFKILYIPHCLTTKSFFFSRSIKPRITIPLPVLPPRPKPLLPAASSATITLPKRLKKNLELKKFAIKSILDEKTPKPIHSFVYLPQNKSYSEIIAYYKKFKGILTIPQYVIILSRIAHLKNAKEYKLDIGLYEIIRKITKLNLKDNAKYITNFIKYSAMIGIHDKLLWRKLISSLYQANFDRNLTELGLTLNYLHIHGMLSKKLVLFMQEKAIDIIDKNPDNQSYRIMELILNSLKNFKLNPELLKVIYKRLHLHLHIMPLKNLRNTLIPSVQMKLDDEELWKMYRKWIYLRFMLARKDVGGEMNIKENYSYFIYTYGKMIEDNVDDIREKFVNEKEYVNLYKLFHEILEENMENSTFFLNSQHFIRVFKGYTIFACNFTKDREKYENILNFLISYIMDKKGVFKTSEIYDIFLCMERLYKLDEYKVFERNRGFIAYLANILIEKGLDMSFVMYKKIVDFYTDEKENLRKKQYISEEEEKSIGSDIYSMMGMMIKYRPIKKEEEIVTLDMILEKFMTNGLIEENIYKELKSEIKIKAIF